MLLQLNVAHARATRRWPRLARSRQNIQERHKVEINTCALCPYQVICAVYVVSAGFEYLERIGLPAYCVGPSPTGELVFVAGNRLWRDLVGPDFARQIGLTAAAFWPGSIGAAWQAAHIEASQKSEPFDARLSLPDRTVVRGYMSSWFHEDGHLAGVTVVAHRDANKDQRSTATQDQLTHEMEKFISMAAHDLRTPMRNVQSLADMLRDGFVDMGDGKLELIDLMEEVAITATSLISDVLSYAQASTEERRKEVFPFKELCDDIHQVVDPHRKHSVTASHGSIEAEKAAVQIIIRNLMDNAVKHGERTSLNIAISVEGTPDGFLEFVVSDNGTGFSDPSLVFLDGGEFRMESGYGMFGIRRMIHERDGKISARNRDEHGGGEVRFTLPGRIVGSSPLGQVA